MPTCQSTEPGLAVGNRNTQSPSCYTSVLQLTTFSLSQRGIQRWQVRVWTHPVSWRIYSAESQEKLPFPVPTVAALQNLVAEHPFLPQGISDIPSAAPGLVSPCWLQRPGAGPLGHPWSPWSWSGWPELAAQAGSEGWPAWCEGWAGIWDWIHTLCLQS